MNPMVNGLMPHSQECNTRLCLEHFSLSREMAEIDATAVASDLAVRGAGMLPGHLAACHARAVPSRRRQEPRLGYLRLRPTLTNRVSLF